jgi:hypothetical protein
VLINMKQHLKPGNLAGNSNLIREVDLAIADFEEFEMMFSARGAQTQHTGARVTIAMWQATGPFPPHVICERERRYFPLVFLCPLPALKYLQWQSKALACLI